VETVEAVHIRLEADHLDPDAMARLRHLLVSHPGDCKTQLHLMVGKDAEAIIALSPKLTVSPSRIFFQEMEAHFGRDSATPVYKAGAGSR
jgi:DNA polymerase III subunit alpha